MTKQLCHSLEVLSGAPATAEENHTTVKRMDNVLIVVDDLEATKTFFIELGLKLEGETTVEGLLVGSLIGLKDIRATLVLLRTPDGQGIELDKFHTPSAIRFGPVDAPVNTLGIRRLMFAVDDLDALVAHMRAQGAEFIGEMQYGDSTGSPTSAGLRASLSGLLSNKAKARLVTVWGCMFQWQGADDTLELMDSMISMVQV